MFYKSPILIFFLILTFTINAQVDDPNIFIDKELRKFQTYTDKFQFLFDQFESYLEKDLNAAEVYIKRASLLVNIDNKKHVAVLNHGLGSVAYRKGDFNKALNHFYKAADLFKNTTKKEREADTYIKIGLCYKYLKQLDKSKVYYYKAIAISKSINDSLVLGRAYNFLGGTYRRLNKIDSSYLSYNNALKIFNLINNKKKVSNVKNDLAILYGLEKRYDKALEVHLSNLPYIKKNHSNANIATTYFNIGYSFSKIKNLSQSLKYLDSSYLIAKREGFKYRLSRITSLKSKLYADLGNYKQAYNQHRLYKIYSDSIFDVQKQEQIKELELKNEFAIKKKELELVASNKEKQYQLYGFIIIIVSLIVFLVALLITRIYKSKSRILATEVEIEKESKEKLTEKVKTSEEELKSLIADNSMRLEFLKTLSSQIKKDKNEADSTVLKEYTNKLLLTIQNQISTENKLSALQEKIDEVNHNFNQKIIQLYPQLTKTEREICSFLRLNLSIKEIAAIRNSSIDAVKSLRYRIRKKMNIPKNQELECFIQAL